jgi:Holliday junction resolvasome RuvABC ATP-dependent DNA helicase subunit
MMNDRLVTAARVDEDAQYEAGLRPRRLDEYIGQELYSSSCCSSAG